MANWQGLGLSNVEEAIKQLSSHVPENHYNPNDFLNEDHNNSLLWGSYRPQAYIGMRTRSTEDSLVFGMMWNKRLGYQPFRHFTRTEDNINFQWIYHNGRDFGIQSILDSELSMETSFVRYLGPFGGDWMSRIESNTSANNISILSYIGIENMHHASIDIGYYQDEMENLYIKGYTPKTQDFILYISASESPISYSGINVDEPWKLESHFRSHFKKDENGNFVMKNMEDSDKTTIAVLSSLSSPFTKDIVFLSNVKSRFGDFNGCLKHIKMLKSNYNNELESRKVNYISQFNKVFKLPEKGLSKGEISFARVLLSNLLGGIGYFQGRNRIYKEIGDRKGWEYSDYYSLTTATPSRPYFPRGFLWDEGFHQLLVSRFDYSLSKDIILHWLTLMRPNGWIPREQILGSEAESRVPPKFIVQYPDHANPPTLLLPLDLFVKNSPNDKSFLNFAYDQLRTHFLWLYRSQKGPSVNSFRWRGSDGNHTLASGLDDYPRARVRSDQEYHVDLLCWMTFSSRMLSDLGKAIGRTEVPLFTKIFKDLNDTLHKQYWSEADKGYYDYDGVSKEYVVHSGYISLFPMIFGLISPESNRLGHVFDMIQHLQTPYGLASLSKEDPLFGTQDDYWRGPIWINLNYLVLRSLKYYSTIEGPSQKRAEELYGSLRQSIITNAYNVYKRQHSFYENYCPLQGSGRGQRPFAGWTSLIVLVMGEIY